MGRQLFKLCQKVSNNLDSLVSLNDYRTDSVEIAMDSYRRFKVRGCAKVARCTRVGANGQIGVCWITQHQINQVNY